MSSKHTKRTKGSQEPGEPERVVTEYHVECREERQEVTDSCEVFDVRPSILSNPDVKDEVHKEPDVKETLWKDEEYFLLGVLATVRRRYIQNACRNGEGYIEGHDGLPEGAGLQEISTLFLAGNRDLFQIHHSSLVQLPEHACSRVLKARDIILFPVSAMFRLEICIVQLLILVSSAHADPAPDTRLVSVHLGPGTSTSTDKPFDRPLQEGVQKQKRSIS